MRHRRGQGTHTKHSVPAAVFAVFQLVNQAVELVLRHPLLQKFDTKFKLSKVALLIEQQGVNMIGAFILKN